MSKNSKKGAKYCSLNQKMCLEWSLETFIVVHNVPRVSVHGPAADNYMSQPRVFVAPAPSGDECI